MKIKYTQIFVKDMEEAVSFFTKKLGFCASDKIAFDKENDQIPMRINNADQYVNLVEDKGESGFKSRIILSTDDCLKDYHNLKTLGIDFKEQPQYLAVGLCAEFNDNYGNAYVLLEERNYNEL
ncbi:VOC family protein [Mucilaginibacter sp. UYCu711]|uniref:VOC family protein n=1 Tax=Mucilaginibacter sp. UYCu711 TaxID=3156339 RepID=UPI003D1ABCC3